MPHRPIRVLHVQALDAIGGTERTNFTLLAAMDRRRFASEICVLGQRGPYAAEYERERIPAHYLHGNPLAFAALCRRREYDLIFFYGLKANLLGRLIAPWFSRATRVEVKHGVDADRGPAARALDAWTAPLTDWFVSNSHAAAAAMVAREAKPAGRITVIPNGIDADSYRRPRTASAGGALRLLAVGNLQRYKGHRFLVEALALLAADGIRCHLTIAGEGPEREPLHALSNRLVEGQVTLAGQRRDIPEMLAAADVLVHASLTEGLPNAIMEAMAAGLPVVTTNAGGCAELVADGETGFVVPAGSAAALAAAIARLARDPDARDAMGRAAAARIRRDFSLQAMVRDFEEFAAAHANPAPPDIVFVATTGMAVHYLIRGSLEAVSAAGYSYAVICGEDPAAPRPSRGSSGTGAVAPAYVARLRRAGIPLHTIPLSRFPNPFADLRSLMALWRLLRKLRPSLVHSCTPKAGLLAPFAAHWAGARPVHSVFGLLFHDRASRWQNLVYRLAERWTAWWSSELLFQSREDLERVARLKWKPAARLLYAGNGVELERFNPRCTGANRAAVRASLGYCDADFVVGTVARVIRTKGIGEFLQAAAHVADRPNIKFVIVGPVERDHPNSLPAAQLEAATAGGRVRFLGERDDVPELYAALDLFALVSYREGIPRSLIEASASALPVIASDIRGCREVVEDGRTGWLVPVRDAAALAERIAFCADHREAARACGREGRARMQRLFDERIVHERMLAFYGTVLSAGHRAGAEPAEASTAAPGAHSAAAGAAAVGETTR